MRFIPTKVHGFLDYTVGAFIAASPWIFGFANGGADTWIPVILGAGALVYSLMTDYELGAKRALSMPKHLAIDFMSGVFLAASPWLFRFADNVWIPHLVMGLFEITASLTTRKTPSSSKAYHRTAASH